MFTVYKITNNVNQKSYIGSSVRVEKRWKDHINASKNPNNAKYNYPLYQAFRKYGIHNFTFEVLKDDFNSIKEMTDYEYDMIILYDSCNNGYNQTLFTDRAENANENLQKYIQSISQKCAKIDINGNILETYTSYHDAAKKNNMDEDNYASLIRRVCKGEIGSIHNLYFRDLDENNNIIVLPIKSSHQKKSIICIPLDQELPDLYFDSISEASKQLNTDRASINKCIKGDSKYSIVKGYIIREIDIYGNIIQNNIDIDERIKEYNMHYPSINGERHSITEWSKIYNISRQSIMKRINKGMDVVEAITTPPRG